MNVYERKFFDHMLHTVKLPYKIPPIICYQFHAFPLGVLAFYNECLPWFYNNYINIKCSKIWSESKYFWIDFIEGNMNGGIPCIDYYIADKTCLGEGKDIFCNYLIDSINNKNYIYTYVDLYHIPNTQAYRKSHFIHDILILGYNLTEENFIVVHFNDKENLVEFEVKSLDLYNAFVNSIGNQDYICNLITLFKRNQTKYEFDLEKVKNGLYNYLNAIYLPYHKDIYFSDNVNMHYCNPEVYQKLKGVINEWKIQDRNLTAWGIDVYNEIIRLYSDLLDDRIPFDLRPLHFMWEHKKIMLQRISYMENVKNIQGLGKIFADYAEIEKKSLIVRNKLLKYKISNNPNILGNIIKQLTELAERERDVLLSLYNAI